ncbi:MAG: hypothetical protein O2816_07385, partial [Planctomycetota bacterium]|nr:hypothetical protein [Planctomycetota bacterium]
MQRALRSSLAAVLLLPSFAQEPITAKLNEHALFSRLGLVSLGDTGNNVRFLAEPPKRPSDTHNPAVEELFAPWLAAVDATFVASYVTPNTLERRGDVPEIGVVMLANGPSFSNAQRYETRPDHLSPKVMWLEHPGVIVGMWTERMQSVPADELRRPVIQRLIERTFVSYYKGSQGAPVERWVVEGVGGYLSACGPEETPADLRNPPADAGALERTLKFKSSPATESLVLPLAVLVENNEPGQREQVGGTRVREAGAKVDRAGIHQLWRDQASLWVHYFERGEGGRHLTGWRHYVAKVLHDNGSLEELASTLGTPVGELEEGFLQHLELLAGGEDLGGGALELSEGTILHPGLAPPAADADAILADALGRASLGELDGALSYLEAGMRVVRGADKGRVATERDRMRVVRETRGAFLADSIKNKRRLRWTTATGESVSAEVTGLADGLLTLGNNKADRASMPVEELSADDLARSLGSKVADHGPEWVGPYLLMLAGDKRWDRKLDADSAEGAALAAASELP